jgi:arylsulfatase A-like enzyme
MSTLLTRFPRLAVAAFAAAAATLATDRAVAAEKPNFVVILADDLGYNDIQCFGSPLVKTPNIDSIAKNGIKFTDFYVAPSCTPSRAAMLTGSYPARVGFGDNLAHVNGRYSPSQVVHPNSPFGLNPDEDTLPEVLKTAGYQTGMVGKWHLGDAEKFNPVHHGFDFFFGMPYSNDMKPYYFLQGTKRLPEKPDNDQLTQRLTKEAVGYIDSHHDKPFFLYMAHAMPHTPLGASQQFKGKSPRGLYGDAVQEVDWSVGQVLEALKRNGVADNTLVMFYSDNGPWLPRGEDGGSATPLRNGKGSTYDGGMRVPCVMQWPGVIPAGTVSAEVASNMDLLPTFAKLGGATLPGKNVIDGKDITELLKATPGAKSPHETFFFFFGNELHGVRSGEWKLRAENNLRNENVYRKDDVSSITMPEALYNVVLDPGEQKNVIKDHPKIADRLRGYLKEMNQDMGDTLHGKMGPGLRPVGMR